MDVHGTTIDKISVVPTMITTLMHTTALHARVQINFLSICISVFVLVDIFFAMYFLTLVNDHF